MLKAMMAVISGAQFVKAGGRKTTYWPVRVDVPVEIAEISAAEACDAGRLVHGRRPGHNAVSEVRFRGALGMLVQPARLYNDTGPVNREYLIRAMGCGNDPVDDNWIPLAQHSIQIPEQRGFPSRRGLDTIGELESRIGTFKTLIDDGAARAVRRAVEAAAKIVLIDGVVHRAAETPLWEADEGYDNVCRVLASPGNAHQRWRCFNPGRRDDAVRLAELFVKRKRGGFRRGGDDGVIEVDPAFAPDTDAVETAFGGSFAVVWSEAGKLLQELPISDLVQWGRLRDMQTGDGGPAEARIVMSEALKFADHIRAMHDGGRLVGAKAYLDTIAGPLQRVREIELPRMGGPAAAATDKEEDEAIADLSDVTGRLA